MRLTVFLQSACLALAGSFAAQAGTLTPNGAYGVQVDGKTYDVEFLDGDCQSVFGSCTDESVLTFNDFDEAEAAAYALLDLFNQQEYALYRNAPAITSGCSDPSVCAILTAFIFNQHSTFTYGMYNILGSENMVFGTNVLNNDPDTTGNPLQTYARWTEVAPALVPLPGAWSLMMVAFSAIGALGLQQRRNADAP